MLRKESSMGIINRIVTMRLLGLLLGTLFASSLAFAQSNPPLDFGYYKIFDQHIDEVSCYTNLYIGGGTGEYGEPIAEWQPKLTQALQHAANANMTIELLLGFDPTVPPQNDINKQEIQAILQAAAPVWDHVKYILVADEPGWTSAAVIDNHIRLVNQWMGELGLSLPAGFKGFGITLEPDDLDHLEPGAITDSQLGWAEVDAYIGADKGNPDDNQAAVAAVLDKIGGKFGDKKVIINMQAYDLRTPPGSPWSIQNLQAL